MTESFQVGEPPEAKAKLPSQPTAVNTFVFGTEGFKIPHILSLYISPEAKIPLVPSMSYLVGYKCSAQRG